MRIPTTKRFLLLPLALAAAVLCARPARARWADSSDAETETEFDNTRIRVAADGAYSTEHEWQVRLLKEAARQSYGTLHFNYNSRASDFKILQAKTINDGREYPVEARMIEDKPLASPLEGFDQFNQVMVAFPETRVGSRVYVRSAERVHEVPLPGVFTTDFLFGYNDDERAAHVRIESAKPLYVQKNDPEDKIALSSREEHGRYVVEISLKSPIYRRAVNETDPYLDGKRLTWVSVSTTKDWGDLARAVLPGYEKVLAAPLPESFRRIADAARGAATPVARMNAITSALADELHYMGDWRPIRGGFIPRGLEEIARTRHGDCKDFAASTVAILRRLGFKADVAWVIRGERPLFNPLPLPVMSFNHAIAVVDVGGKRFWLDATNRASFAQGVPDDIIARPALLLDPKAPALVRVPAAEPSDALFGVRERVDLSAADEVATRGVIAMGGRIAMDWTGTGLDASTQTVRYDVIRQVARLDHLRSWSVSGDDLRSRITRDLTFDFSMREDGPDLRTTAGDGYFLPGGFVSALQVKLADRVSDLFLGQPWTLRRELDFKGAKMVGRRDLACSIDSPWIKAVRRVSRLRRELRVSDEFALKAPMISNAELQSPAFASLRERLRRCFYNAAIVYRRAR